MQQPGARVHLVAAACLAVASVTSCRQGEGSPPTITAATADPTATQTATPTTVPPPPVVASSAPPMPSAFPVVLVDCTTAADCVWDSTGPDCCSRPACEPVLGNKTWQANVRHYCSTKSPKCPPMGCSWGTANPKCVAGRCTDK